MRFDPKKFGHKIFFDNIEMIIYKYFKGLIMKKLYFALVLFLVSICLVSNTDAETWYVKVDGTGDAPTIQAVLDSCMNGDTVLLANGT